MTIEKYKKRLILSLDRTSINGILKNISGMYFYQHMFANNYYDRYICIYTDSYFIDKLTKGDTRMK